MHYNQFASVLLDANNYFKTITYIRLLSGNKPTPNFAIILERGRLGLLPEKYSI